MVGGGGGGWVLKATLVFIFGPRPKLNNMVESFKLFAFSFSLKLDESCHQVLQISYHQSTESLSFDMLSYLVMEQCLADWQWNRVVPREPVSPQ